MGKQKWLLAVAPCAVALSGCVSYHPQASFGWSRDVAANGVSALSVATHSADVILRATNVTTIEVRAYDTSRRPLRDIRADVERGVLHVSWQDPGFSWCFGFDCGARVEIEYPRSLAVTVTTTSGDVTTSDSEAPVTVEARSGDVRVWSASRDVRVRTSSGDVSAHLDSHWRGSAITIATSSGDVLLSVPQGFSGRVSTSTDSGDVNDDAHIRGSVPVTITTTSGDIRLERE